MNDRTEQQKKTLKCGGKYDKIWYVFDLPQMI